MTEPSLDRAHIEQLLQGTGCPDQMTKRFLAAIEAGDMEESLRLLRCQRCRLLERIHDEQRKLNELDYLRYQLERQERSRTTERGSETR